MDEDQINDNQTDGNQTDRGTQGQAAPAAQPAQQQVPPAAPGVGTPGRPVPSAQVPPAGAAPGQPASPTQVPPAPGAPVQQMPPAPGAPGAPVPASANVPGQQGLTTSGLAIAGLVLGIIAILGAFIPFLNILTAPFAIAALVLAVVGLVGIGNGKNSGRGLAIAGIVLGALALVITLAMYGCAAIVGSMSPDLPSSSSALSSSSSASASSSSSTASSSSSSSASMGTSGSSSAATSGGDIDMEKFNAIRQGMTYDEVVAIVGSEGELVSTTTIAGIESTDYQWESDNLGFMTVMFENDAVVGKTQVGLDGASSVKVSLAAFNRVENGMTYAQVVDIMGGEGQLLSEINVAGTSMLIYMWDGEDLLSSCQVTFENGAVTAKSQYGLK